MISWAPIGRHWPGRGLPGSRMPRRAFAYRRHDVDGTVWHVRESLGVLPVGAPTVVLVPGLGSGSYLLRHGAQLATAAKVWIVDLPGFGRSRAPRKPQSVTEWAELLSGWHRTVLGRAPAGYAGSSFGCQVVAALASRHPEVVARMVLVGPTFDASARHLLPQLGRWALTTAREPMDLGSKLLVSYLQSGAGTPMRAFLTALHDPIEERLDGLGVPTLLVHGEYDRIVPSPWVAELARRLRSARVSLVPSVSHTVDYAAADELADLTVPFFCGS